MAADATRPAYWTDRGDGEPAADWVSRMQLLYRIQQLRARLDTADETLEVTHRG
jgi:hypothetical protein